jgi:hypothetical protein
MLLVIEPVGELRLGGRKAIDCDISKRVSSSDDVEVGDVGAGDADRELGDEGLRPPRDDDSESGDRGDKVLSEEATVAEARRLLAVTVNPVMVIFLDLSLGISCPRGTSAMIPLPSVL